jgi:hypothetical protein
VVAAVAGVWRRSADAPGPSAVSAEATADTDGAFGTAQRLAVPAYLDPVLQGDAWARLLDPRTTAAGRVGWIVVNPSNGPGSHPDSRWRGRIVQAHAAGQKVLGYVDTGYLGTTGIGTRDGSTDLLAWSDQVDQDVARWNSFYPGVDGVFLDQVSSACGPGELGEPGAGGTLWAEAYRELTHRVKREHPGAFVVANPGTAVPACFADVADTLVTFEGDDATYRSQRYVPLSWRPTDPGKTCHFVHGVLSLESLAAILTLSRQRGAGYVYATPDAVPNPWDSLPYQGFWAREQQELGRVDPRSNALNTSGRLLL